MGDQDLLRDICNVIPDLIFAAEPQTLQIVSHNQTLQIAIKDQSCTLFDLYPTVDHASLCKMLTAIQAAHPVVFRAPICNGGQLMTCETHFTPGVIGGSHYIIGVARPLTEASKPDQELARLSDLNQKIIEQAPIGIFTYDRKGRVTQVNSAQLRINRIFDQVPSDFLNMQLFEPNGIVSRNRLLEPLKKVLDGIPFIQQVNNFMTRTAELIDVRVYGMPLHGSDGKVTGGLILVEDLTDYFLAEACYQTLFRILPDMLIRISKDGALIDYHCPEGFTAPYFDPVSGWAEQSYSVIERAFKSKQVEVMELGSLIGSSYFEYEFRAIPYARDEVLLMVRDITERKQEQRALERSEARYKALMNALPDLLLRVDKNGIYRDLKTTEAIPLVMPPEAFLNKPITDLSPDITAEKLLWLVQHALETQQLQVHEYQLTLEKREYHFEARFVPIGYEEVLVVVRDITENKQSAEELKRREARYRALVDAIPDLLFRIGRDGTYHDFKVPPIEGLSMPGDDFIGKNVADIVPPHVTELVMPVIGQVLDTRKIASVEYQIEEQNGPHDYEARLSATVEDDVIALVRDITGHKQSQKVLLHKTRLLQGLTEAMIQLLEPGNYETTILRVLGNVGEAIQADRAMIVEIKDTQSSGLTILPRGEWTNSASPFADLYQIDFLRSHLPIRIWQPALAAGEVVCGLRSCFPSIEGRLADQVQLSFCAVPIMIKTVFHGFMIFEDWHEEREWTADEKQVLKTLAAGVGAATLRNRTEQELHQQHEMAEFLRTSASRLLSTLDMEKMLQILLDQIAQVIPYDAANVMLIENGKTRIIYSSGYLELGCSLEEIHTVSMDVAASYYMRTIRDTKEPLVCSDVRNDPGWIQFDEAPPIGSWLGAPILIRGEVVGFFSLDSMVPKFYGTHHCERIAPFIHQASIALTNIRYYQQVEVQAQELKRRYAQLDALFYAGKNVLSTLQLRETLDRFANQMTSIADATSTLIGEYDPETKQGKILATYAIEGARCGDILPPTDSFLDFTSAALQDQIATHDMFPLSDTDIQQAFAAYPSYRAVMQMVIFVPLIHKDEVIGFALIGESRPGESHSLDDLWVCKMLADQAVIARNQARLFSDIQELEHDKSYVIRMASHDLKNPITRVKGALALLEERLSGQLPDGAEKYLAQIARATAEMERITSNILSVARIESQHEQEKPIHWKSLVQSVIEALQDDVLDKNQILEMNCAADLPSTRGDAGQLRQAIYNLVHNAVKYTPAGGQISVQVFVRDYTGSPQLAVEVHDNGIGIPLDQQAQIFQPYFRVKQPGTEGISGYGLGLAFVKRAAEDHKGNVYVDSEVGHGSRFGFWVPILLSS
ncbi:MAG TPA: PAS domain-containing protein [Aggregatilineaceae bacterium]|nr:PAS domain-containing protein [Aggregatilineaceae bacterium]